MSERGDRRLCLGAIAGVHGVHGEVRIKTFTQAPLDIAAYGPLSSEDGTRQFVITRLREARGMVIASLEGVRDRDAAMALKGAGLYIDRDRLPEADEDDAWYHADLIGAEAHSEDGTVLGVIEAIYNFGAGDLLEIKLSATGKTVLVPFTGETVPHVDIAAGVVTVIPPEGLIDDETEEG